jgi:predicted MFS family arabinose efflux permease
MAEKSAQLGHTTTIYSPQFALIVAAQAAFSFGWSLYLLAPKFMATVLGADAEQIGVVAAVGSSAGLLAIPFSALGIDRLGRRLFLRLGAALVVVLSLLYLRVEAIGVPLYLAQCCVSAAYVLAFNGSATLVADLAPPARLSQAIGIIGAVSPFTNAVASALGETIAKEHGWRVVFLTGVAAGLLALGLSMFVREAPRRAHMHDHAQPSAPTRPLTPLLASTVAIGSVFGAMFIFFQPYVLKLGAPDIRTFFIGFTVAAVLARVGFGNLGDRHGHGRVSLLTAILYGIASAAMMYLDIDYLWAFGALFGFAHGLIYPTLNALVLSCMSVDKRGKAMAYYNGAFNAGTAASSALWGVIAERAGYPTMFGVAALMAFVSAALLYQREDWTARQVSLA